MARLCLSQTDGTGSLSRAMLALGNSPFLNERQQTGIGLVMDRVGLILINVLDSNCFSVEVKDFKLFFFSPTCFETILSEDRDYYRVLNVTWEGRWPNYAHLKHWVTTSCCKPFFSLSVYISLASIAGQLILCLCRSLSHFRTIETSMQSFVMVLSFQHPGKNNNKTTTKKMHSYTPALLFVSHPYSSLFSLTNWCKINHQTLRHEHYSSIKRKSCITEWKGRAFSSAAIEKWGTWGSHYLISFEKDQ